MASRVSLTSRRGQETRQRILDAANAVFVRCGYGGASIDEILSEADISKGALYHHFSGKQEIFKEILADHVRRCAEQMSAATDASASLRDNIANILRASWTEAQRDSAWPALQMEFWVHATRDESARKVVAESFAECRQLIAGMVGALQHGGMARSELDPQAAARLFMAINDGIIMLQAQIEPDEVQPDVLIAPMAEMIEGFLTHPTPKGRTT